MRLSSQEKLERAGSEDSRDHCTETLARLKGWQHRRGNQNKGTEEEESVDSGVV